MFTISLMPEPTASTEMSGNELPGERLESGFRFRPTRAVPEATLSEEARARVLEKMDSVDEARLRAAKEGQTAYVG
jgi:hypothetical protein